MTDADDAERRCNQLLVEAGKNDRDALGALFASEAGRLIAVARRILQRRELAEEVVQEAFVSAWRNASSFDPERGSARAWLTTIVRNRALNLLRDGARMDFVPEQELASYSERAAEADTAFELLGEGDGLRLCLDRLEAPRRKSILMAYVLGYTHSEIAAELNVPVGTVKAWIRRGVIALQECLS